MMNATDKQLGFANTPVSTWHSSCGTVRAEEQRRVPEGCLPSVGNADVFELLNNLEGTTLATTAADRRFTRIALGLGSALFAFLSLAPLF